MKQFKMTHDVFGEPSTYFSEADAPKWLREGGVKGSTMDHRWFWKDHVLTLAVGATIGTDFQTITRIA
jgi:hypothetical protein